MSRTPILLPIGRILKPHGRRGKVKVYFFSDEGSLPGAGLEVRTGKDEGDALSRPPLAISGLQRKPSGIFLASFREVGSAKEAASLRDLLLFIDRKLVRLEGDEIFVADLKGMDVCDGGESVGKVEGSYHTGAGEVLVIYAGDGFVDFPFCDEYIEYVDFGENVLRLRNFQDFLDLKYSEAKKGKRRP